MSSLQDFRALSSHYYTIPAMSRFTAVLVASGTSFLAGYLTGVLLAPNSGAETRGWVADQARERSRWIEARLHAVESQVKSLEAKLERPEIAWDVEQDEVERDLRRMPH